MNGRQQPNLQPQGPGFSQRDIFYILFRHKWMVGIFTLIGVLAAAGIYEYWSFPYYSQAKVYIGYMPLPTQGADQLTGTAKIISPDDHGADILNSEMEMMGSHDLALQAARTMGSGRILGNVPQSNSIEAAADFISGHLTNFVPKACDVITMQFSAEQPGIVQPVLSNLFLAYSNMYVQTHLTRSLPDDFLLKQRDQAQANLADAMNKLRVENSKLGVTSLEETKKDHTDLLNRMTSELYDKQAEFEAVSSTVTNLEGSLASSQTNAPKVGATNQVTNIALMEPSAPALPTDVVANYQIQIDLLKARRAKEQGLLTQFTTNSGMVQTAQKQRAETEAEVKKMEQQYPSLAQSPVKTPEGARTPMMASQAAAPDPAMFYRVALSEALTNRDGLNAKIRSLSNAIVQERVFSTSLIAAEPLIVQDEVDITNALQEYQHFLQSSTQANIDEAVGPGRVSNIKLVEAPTTPARNGKKILKASGTALAFFLALAFGLPFFIELVLDQSLKNPLEVQARINQPFFLTIPKTNGAAKMPALKQGRPVALLTANGSEPHAAAAGDESSPPPSNGKMTPWSQRQELQPFFETLRDRLMTYFEVNDMTHKPKLVAVTSCGHGAGVTTTAAGLASSLSETGEGNVLLVNMSARDGRAHHFYKGKMEFAIEDALEANKRDQAQVHDNLYVALESGSNDGALPRMLPKRFSQLVPLMKASDYDYIIFDMPPVSEISITPRLARFMDLVLLVIESEKTSRDAAARVTSHLAQTQPHVGLVLNKNRSYLPKRLDDNPI